MRRVMLRSIALFGLFMMASAHAVISPPDLPSFKVSKDVKSSKVEPPKDAVPKAISTPTNRIPSLTKRDKVKNLYRIKLEWKAATKAAVFFYRDVGYMVFNAPGKLSPGTFPSDYFKGVSIIPHAKSLIVRFTLKKDSDLLVTRMGEDWLILVGPLENEVSPHSYPLTFKSQKDQSVLSVTNDEAELLIAFQDPKSGDDFRVQPDINRGVKELHEMALVDILPSYKGVVYLKKNPDSLLFSVDEKEHQTLVALREEGALTSLDPENRNRDSASVETLIDLGKYDIPQESVFHVGRMMRKDLALETNPQKALAKEIELTKFYLSTGHYHEAAGALELVRQRNPRMFYSHDDLILLYDLAQMLSHKLDDDQLLSNEGEFEGEPERGLVLAMQEQRFGRYEAALKHYVAAYKLIQDLPTVLRNDVAMMAFEAGVESEFIKPIFEGMIQKDLLTRRDLDTFKYYKAQAARLKNPYISLRDTYTKLTFSPNGKVALLSRLALVDKENSAGKSVLKDLESLLFTWRGDVWEQRFLATLADLYHKAGEDDDALRCLRVIASYLWKYEKSHIYTQMAEDLFYKSFMGMGDQPLLKQIGYYYEFEDITPRGERYGKIMTRLTNLYLSVGLNDQALQALKQRVKYLNFEKRRFTLSEADYGHLLNLTLKRMAEVHLISGNNARVIKTLSGLKSLDVAPGKEAEFLAFADDIKFMKAIAHMNMLQYEEVLKNLEGLDNTKAKRLRADVYMARAQWGQALEVLGDLLAASKGEKITKSFDVDAILDIAVVASHLENQEMIQALKEEYGDRIEDPEKRQAFDIIVSSRVPVEITKAKITQQLDVADRYGKLMDGIKKDILETNWEARALDKVETEEGKDSDQGRTATKNLAQKEGITSGAGLLKG